MLLCKNCIDDKVSNYTYNAEFNEKIFCTECCMETTHIPYEIFKEKFFNVISRNYRPLSEMPYRAGFYYEVSDEEGVSTIENIIDWLEINDDLKDMLFTDGMTFFNDEPLVIYDDTLEEYEGCEIESTWNDVQKNLQHNFRYFNSDLKELLDHIFSFIITDGSINANIVTPMPPNTIFYRGRSFDSFEDLIKDIDVDKNSSNENPNTEYLKEICSKFGLVPPCLATDQRMTPYGVSALYLSTKKIACVAEIRALVGQYVGIANFSNRCELNLLNLNELAKGLYPNHLSESYLKDLDIFVFFKKLISFISKPKLNSGKFDYLVSQYFFEYLRVYYGNELDGVCLNSVQMPTADNVILFPEVTKNGIDYCKDENKNKIYFNFDADTFHGFSVSKVKSIEIKTEIDLFNHPRFNTSSEWA